MTEQLHFHLDFIVGVGMFVCFIYSNTSGIYLGGLGLGTVWKYATRTIHIYSLTHFRGKWVREYKFITFKEII